MRTVWKYEIPVRDEPVVLSGPRPLAVVRFEALAPDVITVWAEVDTDAEAMDRTFLVTGTGHPVPEGWRWVATAPYERAHVSGLTSRSLPLVWHVWERP